MKGIPNINSSIDAAGMKDSLVTDENKRCQDTPGNIREPLVTLMQTRNDGLIGKTSNGKTKQGQQEMEEKNARATWFGSDSQLPCRKLVEFSFHNIDEIPRLLDEMLDKIYVTALSVPMDENLEKAISYVGHGPIKSWKISGYDEGTPVVMVSTEVETYECAKPAESYKRYYENIYLKAHACIQVHKELAWWQGGNPDLSLETLISKLTYSLSLHSSAKEYMISIGELIFYHILQLDETSENECKKLSSLPALTSLREQCKEKSELKEICSPISEINETYDEQLPASPREFYVKISEYEIISEYPLPAYYKPAVQEVDECLLMETDGTNIHAPPSRSLNNWCIYCVDLRLIPLELLPMQPWVDNDISIFGSGCVREDERNRLSETDTCQSSSSKSEADYEGIPTYLSEIKEWKIELLDSLISMSIRTDLSWYRLGKPAKQYVPWYNPILKTARVAVSIINLFKDQGFVPNLSFSELIKKVSEFEVNHSAHISSDIKEVERYLVVHGEIILKLFVQESPEIFLRWVFKNDLLRKMNDRYNMDLVMCEKFFVQNKVNLNPCASIILPESQNNVMQATTTRLINRIWVGYYLSNFSKDSKEGNDSIEEDENEQEESEGDETKNEEETLLFWKEIPKLLLSIKPSDSEPSSEGIKWQGSSAANTNAKKSLFNCTSVHGDVINVGGVVVLKADESALIYVEYMYQKQNGAKIVHGRLMVRGYQTFLENTINQREIFLTEECLEFELGDVKESVSLEFQPVQWNKHRVANEDRVDSEKAKERKKEGQPNEYYCKSLYCPHKGSFLALPIDTMGLGNGNCYSCKLRNNEKGDFIMNSSKSSFSYKKIKYHIHDYVYISSKHFDNVKKDHALNAGRNTGLKSFVVCQLLEIEASKECYLKEPIVDTALLKVRRFYRPEDISAERAYANDLREVFYSEDKLCVPVEAIEGKCYVRNKKFSKDLDFPVILDHIFFCDRSYDPVTGAIKQLPSNIRFQSSAEERMLNTTLGKGKSKIHEEQNYKIDQWKDAARENCLVSLDIFSGCGGLTEGLEQSGVSLTKWAIDHNQPAGEAFSSNHPEAFMFINDCNVILRAVMEKNKDLHDCISTTKAAELAALLDKKTRQNLPSPIEVDFIIGGLPRQSSKKRSHQSTWIKVQHEAILAFLSFADYFRPKFILLENILEFLSCNKGQAFRLTIISLLEMGYQVRFGVLQCGNYGVAQYQKRLFIWAASPEEVLPEWPEPMHVSAGPDGNVPLSGDTKQDAPTSMTRGAPFRSLTVKDTIGDLPPIEYGESKSYCEYGTAPTTWFQEQLRGTMTTLYDHRTKGMDELSFLRCTHVPCLPGADWRYLPDLKVALSTGQKACLIPWWIPHKMKNQKEWKGLFGRLDWESIFPTSSINDPQSFGKIPRCFHPIEDRILSVRECARAQGFPDSYDFPGRNQDMYRTLANAVPPPVSHALGRKLKEAIDAKCASRKINLET